MTSPRPPATRDRIAHATLELLVAHGLSGVTMTAIAEKAGVARQTLYNHYPDVDSIVAASIVTHQRESFGALRSILETIADAPDRMAHLTRHLAATAEEHLPIPNLLAGLAPAARESLSAHETELQSLIEDTLTLGVATGAYRSDLDVPMDAHLVRRMLQGMAELVGRDPSERSALIQRTTRTISAALAR